MADKECDKISRIVQSEYTRGHGHFLKSIFDAWDVADPLNQQLMLPLMKALVEKYRLKVCEEEVTCKST